MRKDSGLWYVYMVRCSDGSLYTGISKDLEKRLEAHNSGKDGARYTRSRRPVTLVYAQQVESRSAAASLAIPDKKTYARRKGRTGCNKEDPEWHRLARLTA